MPPPPPPPSPKPWAKMRSMLSSMQASMAQQTPQIMYIQQPEGKEEEKQLSPAVIAIGIGTLVIVSIGIGAWLKR